MASLFRPLSRCLVTMKKANNLTLLSVVKQQQQMRFKSEKPTTGGLDKALEKKPVDETADPKESYLADPWDLLYGAERFEIAMKTKGYDDPYDMEPHKRKAVSTAADPNIVCTLENNRMIACVCEADTHHVNFWQINLGETKRCECGHWFKCVERELPDLSEFGIHLQKGHH